MLEPRQPMDEAERIEALHALHIVGSPPEARFDRLTRVAAGALRAEMAYISFIDRDMEWFKAAHGWPVRQIPRNDSLGAHAILQSAPLAVEDLAQDDRFSDAPLCKDVGVRAYAAHPIRGPAGGQIGVLAVMQRSKRCFSKGELAALQDLAALAEDELALRQRPVDAKLEAPRLEAPAGVEAHAPSRQLSKAMIGLVEALPWPVAVLDGRGVLRHHNEAWHEAIGQHAILAPQDAEGLDHVARLRHLEDARQADGKAWSKQLRALLVGEVDAASYEYAVERDEREMTMVADARAWQERDERWAVVTHRPVARNADAPEADPAVADAAIAMALEAEDVHAEQRRRDRILDAFSKRLNTPVTPILLQLHMLEEGHLGPISKRQHKALEAVARNVERWNRTCTELMRRIQGERQVGPSDLAEIVNEVVASRKPAALQAGINMHSRASDQLIVPLSEDDVRRMVEGFLDRAIAATPAGSSLVLTAEEEDEHVLVQCLDGGGPMDHADALALFDPASLPYAPDNAGLIRIAAMAESAGGRAWAEPGPSGGAVLCFSLPVAAVASPEKSEKSTE